MVEDILLLRGSYLNLSDTVICRCRWLVHYKGWSLNFLLFLKVYLVVGTKDLIVLQWFGVISY